MIISSCDCLLFQLLLGEHSAVTDKIDVCVYLLHTSVIPIKPSPVGGHEHSLFPK